MTSTVLQHLVTFGLLATRCSAVFFFIPMLGGESVPVRLRAAFALVIAGSLTPVVGQLPIIGLFPIMIAGIGEIAIGTAIGFIVRSVLAIAEMAGEIAGLQMGFAFNRIVDPLTKESGAVPARMMGLIALLLFLTIDGPQLIIQAIATSLINVPPGAVLDQLEKIPHAFRLLSISCSVALRIAAPVMVALLLTNAAIGLLARAAPQLKLFVLAFGVTIGVGMLMFGAAAWPMFNQILRQLQTLPQYLAPIVGG